jgi:rare lipoprotein A
VKGDAVVLQIASFAARANAERALAMLEGAGIRDARLFDATAAGQKVWRLRVGPVAGERVAELSATVAGLGFGRPNIVRD